VGKKYFPDVLIGYTEIDTVQHHDAYQAAKHGDAHAASNLVKSLVSANYLDRLRAHIRSDERSPILAAVHAVEAEGRNEIAAALAAQIGLSLHLSHYFPVVQANIVQHTRADPYARLSKQAVFVAQQDLDSSFFEGRSFYLVDDFVGHGGTFANLRGFVMANGGTVIGATALAGRDFSAKIALRHERLNEVRGRYGSQFETEWKSTLGFSFDGLTQSEGRFLAEKVKNVDEIRDRIFASR
jgi:adenine/guanine phosphoribosyltransferase-like PRPP-binding protein